MLGQPHSHVKKKRRSEVTAIQEFTDVFRAEHREVRDLLPALVEAFDERNAGQARALVAAVAQATGRISDTRRRRCTRG